MVVVGSQQLERTEQKLQSVAGHGAAAYEIDWTDPAKIPDEQLQSFIRTQFEAGKQRRQGWERQASKQLAWANGDQESSYLDDAQDLSRVSREITKGIPFEFQYPIVINSIKGKVFQRIALMLGAPVTLNAIAQSPSDEDINAARVATKVLQYMWRSGPDSVSKRFIEALWYMFCTGVCWIHPCWDAFKGELENFGPDKDPDPVKAAATADAWKLKLAESLAKGIHDLNLNEDGSVDLPPGEVDWQFRTGFDITEPEFAFSVDECEWLIDTNWRTMEYVRFRYGEERTETVNPDDGSSSQYLTGWRTAYGHVGEYTREGVTNRTKAELVMLHSLWRPVRPWAPVGALVICSSQGVILYKGPNPYPHGELPFVQLKEFPVKHFRPPCTVQNMMTLQGARNRNRSQIAAAVHMAVAPKILREEECQIAEDAFDSQDRIIDVGPGGVNKIKAFENPKLPSEAIVLDQLYVRDLEDVAEVHASTTGRGESGQQSGKHAQILQAADSRATMVPRLLAQSAIAHAGSQSLWLWWKYVSTERMVVIPGDDSEGDVLQFKGLDLLPGRTDEKGQGKSKPGPHDFNVRVVMGPDQERQQQVALVEMMTTMGYWRADNVDDRIKVEKLLGQPGSGELDANARHRKNAASENRKLVSGASAAPDGEVVTAPGDQDQVHFEEHGRFTTTAEYRQAVKTKPQVQEQFEIHMRAHQFAAALKRQRLVVIEELAGATLRQEMMPGNTAGPPTGTKVAPPAEGGAGGNGSQNRMTAIAR